MPLISDIESIIYGKNNINVVGLRGIDLWTSETHSIKSKITKYPVEDGGSITDHSYREPNELILSGFISNINIITTDIPLVIGSLGYSSTQKVKIAWQGLKKLSLNKELLTIVTTADTYNNMLVSFIETSPIDKDTGTSLSFRIKFSEVIIVETSIKNISPTKVAGSNNPAGSMTDKVDGGLHSPENANNITTSLLKQWL